MRAAEAALNQTQVCAGKGQSIFAFVARVSRRFSGGFCSRTAHRTAKKIWLVMFGRETLWPFSTHRTFGSFRSFCAFRALRSAARQCRRRCVLGIVLGHRITGGGSFNRTLNGSILCAFRHDAIGHAIGCWSAIIRPLILARFSAEIIAVLKRPIAITTTIIAITTILTIALLPAIALAAITTVVAVAESLLVLIASIASVWPVVAPIPALALLALIAVARAIIAAMFIAIIAHELLLRALIHRRRLGDRTEILGHAIAGVVVTIVAAIAARTPAAAVPVHGIARLLQLLMICHDDAIVVFGVLQIVLCQHRVTR